MNCKRTNTRIQIITISLMTFLMIIVYTGLYAQTAQYPDPLLSTPATAEVISKGLESDGYALGVLAYTWGYPLVRMERVLREYTDVPETKSSTIYRAPLNQIGWARELATPKAKDMPTANNDTFYMSAVVKLDEPYILTVPDTKDRYYVVDVFNMWHELEHYIGRRMTGTKAGRFVIVPPGWKGTLPSDAKRLEVTTNKVWLWGRMRVVDGEDAASLHALQDSFSLVPLQADKKSNYSPKTISLKPMPDIGDDGLGFLTHLGFALQNNPVKSFDEALLGQLERIGLTKKGFDPSRLNEAMQKGVLKGLKDGPLVATASLASSPLVMRNQGWDFSFGLDRFGFNYPFRAMIAGPYLGGQGEKEAIYPIRYTDSVRKNLSGSNRYIVRFKQEPPVAAFWSLTIYNANDKMLIENPINRYKIGGDTPGFTTRKNGYFEIPVQHNKPEGEFSNNWLPAPEGNFYLLLRLYQPREEILSGKYELPEMERVK